MVQNQSQRSGCRNPRNAAGARLQSDHTWTPSDYKVWPVTTYSYWPVTTHGLSLTSKCFFVTGLTSNQLICDKSCINLMTVNVVIKKYVTLVVFPELCINLRYWFTWREWECTRHLSVLSGQCGVTTNHGVTTVCSRGGRRWPPTVPDHSCTLCCTSWGFALQKTCRSSTVLCTGIQPGRA